MLRKVDLLLGKEKKRPLPGAKCDFQKAGRDDLSTKRTWELVDKLDNKFFEIILALKNGKVSEANDLAQAGMTICAEKAQVAHIAFKNGGTVANFFEEGTYEDDFSAEDRKKLKRARADVRSGYSGSVSEDSE